MAKKHDCPKTINLIEKSYYRRNDSISSFKFFTFLIDLSNLASIFYGFKYQVILFKFLRKTLLGKRLLNDRLDRENLNFLSIYLGLAIALLQFIYYLNEYIQFDTYKRMEIGKRSSTEELSISVCLEKSTEFLYSNLNYDQQQEEIFLRDFRKSITSISLPNEEWLNDTAIDRLVFNETRIFFKDSALCYQFQFPFKQPLSSYGSIFFSYFVQPQNRIEINFKDDFDHFYLTKNMDLPYFAEKFFYEQFFTIFEIVEMEYPMKTNCTHYQEVYKNCSNQFECFQV